VQQQVAYFTPTKI